MFTSTLKINQTRNLSEPSHNNKNNNISRGIMHHRFSHIRLVLREIDFPTKLLQAESINAKRKWLGLLQIAREDAEKASIEQDELAELEAMAAKIEEDAKKKREEEEQK